MKILSIFTVLLVLFICSCGLVDVPLHGIEWYELSGNTYGINEELNIYQIVHISMRFGYGDTIYMIKKYWDPTKPTMLPWFRYFRCPVYNKHYEIPPPISNNPEENDTNLVFQYSLKEYADPLYQQPIIDNSTLIDWFVWKEENSILYMGYVDLNKSTYYWEWNKE